MRIAFVLPEDRWMNDKLFDVSAGAMGAEFNLVQKYFEEHGGECHTCDMYLDFTEIDVIFFYNMSDKWYKKALKEGIVGRCVYIATEPETFEKKHTEEALKSYWTKYFPYILTWNKNVINKKQILEWHSLNIVKKQWLPENEYFWGKRLLTCISGNKVSNYPDELYSTRRKVIDFLEKNTEYEFDLYGTGWEDEELSNFKSTIKMEEKTDIYHKYKFALALESTRNLNGYISEKIFDCFNAGIVPIYAGSINIDDYVPRDCYIDYFAFPSIEELIEYINNMKFEEYRQYQLNIERYLASDKIKMFGVDTFCQCLEDVSMKMDDSFNVAIYDKKKFMRKYYRERILYYKIKMLQRIRDTSLGFILVRFKTYIKKKYI